MSSCLVITKYQGGIISMLQHDNSLEAIHFHGNQNKPQIGDIYVAKVMNIVKNINAAFIQFQPDQRGYLSLEHLHEPVLLNRTYDGRLLCGDEILVQLDKEAIKTKDPVFTTNLSLSGKYCVVSNGNLTKGVSAKLTKQEKEILYPAIPQNVNYGVIIRTNAASLIPTNSIDELTCEIQALCNQLDQLVASGIHRTCYSRLTEATPEYVHFIRDEYQNKYDRILTDDEDIFSNIKNYLEKYEPEKQEFLSLYQDDSYPLHKLYRIDTKIQELLHPKVWLKSGAYLIIEQTEAMHVIDVNSGKNIAKKENEEYVLKINLEAAKEIMKQISLRNLSGMIIIDFINMSKQESIDSLMNELHKLARKDPVKTNIVDMTALGLVEITRKKGKKSLQQQFFENESIDI